MRDASTGISLAREKREEFFEEQLGKYPQEAQDIIEMHESDVQKYKVVYLNMLLTSSFSSSYFVFEALCTELCRLAMERVKLKLSYKDVQKSPNVMETVKIYFNKGIGINLSHLSGEWDKLDEFRKIRNSIVHQQSNILTNNSASIEKQDLYHIVMKYKSIKLNKKTGYFYLKDDEIVLEFMSVAKKYLRGVLKEILKLKQKRRTRKINQAI
jgi:hypothetical protein